MSPNFQTALESQAQRDLEVGSHTGYIQYFRDRLCNYRKCRNVAAYKTKCDHFFNTYPLKQWKLEGLNTRVHCKQKSEDHFKNNVIVLIPRFFVSTVFFFF